MDTRLSPAGEYVFLEINPVAQFRHVERAAELPIAQAVAERLALGQAVATGNTDNATNTAAVISQNLRRRRMQSVTTPRFLRVRFTWLAYVMLAFYSYMQVLVRVLVPFLRAELHLSYRMGALHISAFALGALCLTLGSSASMTIASTGLMGFWGSLLLMMLQAGLSDLHGEQRAVAMTEANIAA